MAGYGKGWSGWLRYAVMLLLIAGLVFRFVNLDRKIYWLDEVFTSLRISGYTEADMKQAAFTGEVIGVEALHRYQHPNPERGLMGLFKGLATEEPQITPLYFVLTKAWLHLFGDSVAVTRSFSAVTSLLAFPCLWWLCWELFQSVPIAWVAIALFSISPLHVLYAQEARPYSLWTTLIILASAVLLRAFRTGRGWITYGVTLALGLYTHLLFGLVAIAHGLYAIAVATRLQSQPPPSDAPLPHPLKAYGWATAGGCLALLPWGLVLWQNLEQAQTVTASLRKTTSLDRLLDQWGMNHSRALVGWDLGSVNILLIGLVLWSLYVLFKTASRRHSLFLLLLIAIPFLALAIPDLVTQGGRSTRVRYLIPSYVGIQITLAYCLTLPVSRLVARRWQQAVLTILICANVVAGCLSAQADIWWTKSVPRSSYYPPVSQLVNQVNHPLLISDGAPMEVLAFSRWLQPHVQLELLTQPRVVKIPLGFDQVFLLNPSPKLRTILTRRNYRLRTVFKDPNAPESDEDRLWQVEPG